jgi:hypothetical protein
MVAFLKGTSALADRGNRTVPNPQKMIVVTTRNSLRDIDAPRAEGHRSHLNQTNFVFQGLLNQTLQELTNKGITHIGENTGLALPLLYMDYGKDGIVFRSFKNSSSRIK